jgi:hypothetical protein
MPDAAACHVKTYQAVAHATKTKNIIEMALGFSVMTRVFSEGSKTTIFNGLEGFFTRVIRAAAKEDYESVHTDFCAWFTEHIRTAEKKLKNGRIKASIPGSFGQAAKVVDIAAKVYFYYCAQPDPAASQRLVPMLHGAVDTPIMRHLGRRFPDAGLRATSIEQIDQTEYERLQSLVARSITEDFESQIYPVQYDDIMWRRLNRGADELARH